MKRFFLSMVVYLSVLSGMVYAETTTHTWTDENGVKHIVTTTRETQKSTVSGNDSEQSTAADQGSQELQPEQPVRKQAAPDKPKADKQGKTDKAPTPSDSFQFEIDSHKPKF